MVLRILVVVALSSVVLAQNSLEQQCAAAGEGARIPDPADCRNFYRCAQGSNGVWFALPMTCPIDRGHFNKCTELCENNLSACMITECDPTWAPPSEEPTTTTTVGGPTEEETTTTTTTTTTEAPGPAPPGGGPPTPPNLDTTTSPAPPTVPTAAPGSIFH